MKPPTTFDPTTSQYCCPVIVDPDEPADAPWHVAYFDVDVSWSGDAMVVDVTEIVTNDGASIDLAGLDMEWITEQCHDELCAASRDDAVIYKRRSAA